MAQFVVLSLPRSRSFWLSRFLTYGPWRCDHDGISHLRRPGDLDSWWALPQWGSCETAGAYWWRVIPDGVRVVTVRRPVGEVVDSLARLFPFNRSVMEREMSRLDAKLDQVEGRRPGVLSVGFHELAAEDCCAEVFEHCLDMPHDSTRWRQLSRMNLQVDLRKQVQYCMAYKSQLEQMAGTMKAEVLRSLRDRGVAPLDGMTIQQESFARWYSDAKDLFEEHLAMVDEPVDNYTKKNLDLLSALDARGELQILTARSNGRMFGYLVTLIAPSLERPTLLSALHTTFFVGANAPKGLGLRLQRCATEMLREKHVGEAFIKTTPRGSGARIGSLAKRLGYAPFGQLYKLDLEGV